MAGCFGQIVIIYQSQAPFFLVVEVAGASEEHNGVMLEQFLEATMESGDVVDGVVAQDLSQAAEIWALREGVTEALRHRGISMLTLLSCCCRIANSSLQNLHCMHLNLFSLCVQLKGAIYKYDLSFGSAEMYDIVEAARVRMTEIFPEEAGGPIKVVGYGHLGDGNIHLNISTPAYEPRYEQGLEPWVYEFTATRKGSISAEHGLGRMKAPCIGYSKTPEAVAAMRLIKQALDPRGILNPYKVLV